MSEAPLASDIARALGYPAELAQEVLARYGQQLAVAPTGLTSAVVLDSGPPPQVAVQACSDGRSTEVRTWFDDWRRWAEGSEETVVRGSGTTLDTSTGEPPASTVVTTATWLRRLDDDVIAVLADAVLGRRPTVGRAEVRRVTAVGLLLRLTTTALTEAEVPEVEQRLAELDAALSAIGAIGSAATDGSIARSRLTIDDLPPTTD